MDIEFEPEDVENHTNECEIYMLYKKYAKLHCPLKFRGKYGAREQCDTCQHLRYVGLADDWLTITRID